MSVLADTVGDFAGHAGVKVMLLDDTNMIGENWDDINVLNSLGGATLGEYMVSGSTRRLTLAGVAVTPVGSNVKFESTAPIWTSLVTATSMRPMTHMLVYVEKVGATADPALDLRVALCLVDLAHTPDGNDLPVAYPTDGLFTLNTNGC